MCTSISAARRGGRVAEGTTLLTWQALKSLEGSNPSLSANISRKGLRHSRGLSLKQCGSK